MDRNTTDTPKQRKRPKPARAITILEQPTADTEGWAALKITVGKQTDTYLVRVIPTDFGAGAIGFEVEKLDADLATVESYQVHLSDRPEDVSCNCKGHERHGHCKHREGLEALRRAGRLPRLWTARDARRDPEPGEPPDQDAYDRWVDEQFVGRGEDLPELPDSAYADPAGF